jgi:hypothetical protein
MRRLRFQAANCFTMAAAISTFVGPVLGRHSRAATGRHTGRVRNGSSTMIPTTTKQTPNPTGFSPRAAPSCCQAAPNTFLPRRLNSVSSTAQVSAAPSGSSVLTISRDRYMPRVSPLQAAREKKLCARSCGQEPASPAPASMPVTVPLPVLAISPAASAVKVAKLGAVNTHRRFSSTANKDMGNLGAGSIGGLLFAGGNHHRRCFSGAASDQPSIPANRPIRR